MKLTPVALACLLLAAVWLQEVDGRSMHVSSSNCCFSFVERKIPLKMIHCYRKTSSTCPYDAFIFKMKGGRESCALNTEGWVQGYLKKIKPCLPKGK
ncbi:C-C motif chemokine 1 [Ochotona princeps]|uniref:C-C motif chemokine 1 n=1 Tax=Ochotona princeps TaxID=9978 RepID=UPI0027151799|nr:C-C motif chemokine 1 [Ochotona princeps]